MTCTLPQLLLFCVCLTAPTAVFAQHTQHITPSKTTPNDHNQDPDPSPPKGGPWTRTLAVQISAGYPEITRVAFNVSPHPRTRISISYQGLAPFVVGFGMGFDYALTFSRTKDFWTLRPVTFIGLETNLTGYNFREAGVDIDVKGLDASIGPHVGFELHYGPFSLGAAIGALIGDLDSLHDLGSELVFNRYAAPRFSVGRFTYAW